MFGTKEKVRQLNIASSKVEISIFTPEQGGEDELGLCSLTQSHSVSRSGLDFRNFVQLPCVRLADTPLPSPFPHASLLL